jgi:hypothetical protein
MQRATGIDEGDTFGRGFVLYEEEGNLLALDHASRLPNASSLGKNNQATFSGFAKTSKQLRNQWKSPVSVELPGRPSGLCQEFWSGARRARDGR